MKLLAKAAIAALTVWGCSTSFALSSPSTQMADASALAGQSASADALFAEHWIRAGNDNHGGPFAIVDKKAARIFVFTGEGKLLGTSPTLLGADRGDVPVPGSEHKAPSQLRADERRTPAGRFQTVPGRNNFGEPVVWVDYDSSIAIHRVRPDHAQASRLQSLSNELPDDKRRSLGCVVVPEAFLSEVVLPALGHSPGVVYILPEEESVQALFAPLTPATVASATPTLRTAAATSTLRAATVPATLPAESAVSTAPALALRPATIAVALPPAALSAILPATVAIEAPPATLTASADR